MVKMLKLTMREGGNTCHVALDKIAYVVDYTVMSALFFVDGTSIAVNEEADMIVDEMRSGG